MKAKTLDQQIKESTLYLSGKEFIQEQLVEEVSMHPSVASLRLRELYWRGMLSRREVTSQNNLQGIQVLWSRRRSLNLRPLSMKWGAS